MHSGDTILLQKQKLAFSDFHISDRPEMKGRWIKGRIIDRRQVIINMAEISAWCAAVFIAGQHKQILRTCKSRVVTAARN